MKREQTFRLALPITIYRELLAMNVGKTKNATKKGEDLDREIMIDENVQEGKLSPSVPTRMYFLIISSFASVQSGTKTE